MLKGWETCILGRGNRKCKGSGPELEVCVTNDKGVGEWDLKVKEMRCDKDLDIKHN
jgi:hypothetical protein